MKDITKLNKIVGVSITERRGKWRVKLGKKITLSTPLDKLFATEQEACTYAQSWTKDRSDRAEAAKLLSDSELTDAWDAIQLLSSAESPLSLKDVVRDYLDADNMLKAVNHKYTLLETTRKYVDALPEKQAVTIAKLIDLYLVNREEFGEAGERHLKQLEYSFKPLKSYFGDKLIHLITKQQFEKCMKDLHGTKAAKTYNNHRLNYSALLTFGIEQEILKKNVLKFSNSKTAEKREIEAFTPDEVKAILNCSMSYESRKGGHQYLFLMLSLQAFAGIRVAEIMRMTWSCFVDDEIVLTAAMTKTSQRRVIPILPPLKAILDEHFAGMHPKKKLIGISVRNFEAPRRRIAEKLKIEWKHNGLRHSFVTFRLLQLGNDYKQTAEEAGHTEEMTKKHYKAVFANGEKLTQQYWDLYNKDIINIKTA